MLGESYRGISNGQPYGHMDRLSAIWNKLHWNKSDSDTVLFLGWTLKWGSLRNNQRFDTVKQDCSLGEPFGGFTRVKGWNSMQKCPLGRKGVVKTALKALQSQRFKSLKFWWGNVKNLWKQRFKRVKFGWTPAFPTKSLAVFSANSPYLQSTSPDSQFSGQKEHFLFMARSQRFYFWM